MKTKNVSIIRIIAVFLIIASMVLTLACCGKKNDQKAAGGKETAVQTDVQTESAEEKSVTIRITGPDGKTESVHIKTDAETLADALLENKLASGSDSEYGLFITSVNGIEAEEGYFWAVVDKDGAMLQTGVSSTPVNDGDVFGFEYTKIDY